MDLVGLRDSDGKRVFLLGVKEKDQSSRFECFGEVSIDDEIEQGLVYDQFDNKVSVVGKGIKLVRKEFDNDLVRLVLIEQEIQGDNLEDKIEVFVMGVKICTVIAVD